MNNEAVRSNETTGRGWGKRAILGLLVLLACLLPLATDDPYWMHVFILTLIYIIVSSQLSHSINFRSIAPCPCRLYGNRA